jgi:hypothetical protein
VIIFGISSAKPEAVLFSIFLDYLRMCFLFRSCYFLAALEACLGVLGGEIRGPASRSRVTPSVDVVVVVVVVVVFVLFARSLFLVMGFALFVVRFLSLSIWGVWSVELVQYINWGSGCCSIPFSHTGITIRSQRMLYLLR